MSDLINSKLQKVSQEEIDANKSIENVRSKSRIEMDTETIKIILTILEKDELSVDDITNLSEQLKYYSNPGTRLLYSVITKEIINLKDNIVDNIQNSLLSVMLKFETSPLDIQYKIISKLWDHFELANYQYDTYNNETSKLRIKQELKETVGPIVDRMKEITEKYDIFIERLNKEISGIQTQVISILSVFAAITFVVFGGLSTADAILSKLPTTNLSALLIVGAIMSEIMLCVIYAFMLFILVILGKSIDKFKLRTIIFISIVNILIFISAFMFEHLYFIYR